MVLDCSTHTAKRQMSPPPYSQNIAYADQNILMEQAPLNGTDDGRLVFYANLRTKGQQSQCDDLLKSSELSLDTTEKQPKRHGNPSKPAFWARPSLNIVILVVGSRGDVQPFLRIGTRLQEVGHRVRLATHGAFQNLVEGDGLEFFNIGGNPASLMAYMVENPGMVPRMQTVWRGDIWKRRAEINEIIDGCWEACVEPFSNGSKAKGQPLARSVNAIIANPPSFAHIHCAEALRIPLHIMFTMPWSPTQSFSHPLADVEISDAGPEFRNRLSFVAMDTLNWQGLGDLLNNFRKRHGLAELDTQSAAGMLSRLNIPHTYLWSPSILPAPQDWPSHVEVAGFVRLQSLSDVNPPADLKAFLDAGDAPIYIGFGSIVLEKANELTEIVMGAVQKLGRRAILAKGWGSLRKPNILPESIFFLEQDVPHDWLFPQTCCVVHHGGAGTTAAGLMAGKPTVVVPFFGDQHFWGFSVAQAGAGPQPIPFKQLTSEKLFAGLRFALSDTCVATANKLGRSMDREDGAEAGVTAFHHHLENQIQWCRLMKDRPAVFISRGRPAIRLSACAAAHLRREGHLQPTNLSLFATRLDVTRGTGPYEPVSGAMNALFRTMYSVVEGLAKFPKALASAHKNTLDVPNTMKELINVPIAIARSPLDFNAALANGFRNAPRLYGDANIRKVPEITGLTSGLTAAGKELALGVFDGVAGLLTCPIAGAKIGGTQGFFKGVAKGVGGLVCKPAAGIFGVSAYAGQGLYEEMMRAAFGADASTEVPMIYLTYGFFEAAQLSESEKRGIVAAWEGLKWSLFDDNKHL